MPDRPSGRQRVGVTTAVGAGRIRRPQQPVHAAAGVGRHEVGQGEQGAGGRVAGADHGNGLTGELGPQAPSHVGHAVEDPPGGPSLGFAVCGQAVAAQRVRCPPGAGCVDDGRGRQLGAVGQAQQERGRVAAGGTDLVESLAGRSRSPRSPNRRCGAIAGCAASGARYLSTSSPPVGNASGSGAAQPVGASSARAAGSVLKRHGLNRRTCAHCRTDARDAVAGLEDQEVQAARSELGRGGQTDRAGADHRDGKSCCRCVHRVVPFELLRSSSNQCCPDCRLLRPLSNQPGWHFSRYRRLDCGAG